MKTFLLLLLAIAPFAASAQSLLLAPYLEKTVAGNQYGTQLLYELRSEWSVGVFYQKSVQPSEGLNSYYPFYGAVINAPLVKSPRLTFLFSGRGGVVNDHFLVFTPGVETKIKLSKVFQFSVFTSVRMASPSAALKLSLRI